MSPGRGTSSPGNIAPQVAIPILKAFLPALLLAVASVPIIFKLSLMWIIGHPQHDPMEGLQAVLNALVGSFAVDVIAWVWFFRFFRRRSTR
jgi:hypothetical protein